MSDSKFVALTQQFQQYLQQVHQGYNDSSVASIPNYQLAPMSQFQFNPNMFIRNTSELTNETNETKETKAGYDD